MDSFDPKPKLDALDGQPFWIQIRPLLERQWLKSPWTFKHRGQCGLPISDLFPHLATCADDLAVIRSMKADLPLHSTGVLYLHTGSNNAGRPSLGSWVTYGLGSENQNLPGFVVLNFDVVPCGGMETYSAGFLPATNQSTLFKAEGVPIENIVPGDSDARIQRAKLDLLSAQDQAFSETLGNHAGVEAAIRNYEMAFRMQSLVPDVLNLDRESEATSAVESTRPISSNARNSMLKSTPSG